MDKLVEELRSGKRKCSFPMSRTLAERPLTLKEWREVSQQAADALAIAQKRVNELEERVRTLEFHVAQRGAALAPFAEACSNCIDDEPDNGSTWEHPVGMEVTFRDFRDARDVLDLPSAALRQTQATDVGR